MKFNRMALIERLENNRARVLAEHADAVATWEFTLAAWRKRLADEQTEAVVVYAGKLLQMVGDTLDTPLRKKDFPKIPWMPVLGEKPDRWMSYSDIDDIVISDPPKEIGDIRNPGSAPNTEGLDRLIDALKLALDEDVTTSGIENLGVLQNLRAWL